MWVAYSVPRKDHHLVVEDGLGYLALGETRETAEANVRELFDKGEREQAERTANFGYDPEPLLVLEEAYVLHSNEV